MAPARRATVEGAAALKDIWPMMIAGAGGDAAATPVGGDLLCVPLTSDVAFTAVAATDPVKVSVFIEVHTRAQLLNAPPLDCFEKNR